MDNAEFLLLIMNQMSGNPDWPSIAAATGLTVKGAQSRLYRIKAQFGSKDSTAPKKSGAGAGVSKAASKKSPAKRGGKKRTADTDDADSDEEYGVKNPAAKKGRKAVNSEEEENKVDEKMEDVNSEEDEPSVLVEEGVVITTEVDDEEDGGKSVVSTCGLDGVLKSWVV